MPKSTRRKLETFRGRKTPRDVVLKVREPMERPGGRIRRTRRTRRTDRTPYYWAVMCHFFPLPRSAAVVSNQTFARSTRTFVRGVGERLLNLVERLSRDEKDTEKKVRLMFRCLLWPLFHSFALGPFFPGLFMQWKAKRGLRRFV